MAQNLHTSLDLTGHSKPEVNYITIEEKYPEFWMLVKDPYTDNYVINIFKLRKPKKNVIMWVSA